MGLATETNAERLRIIKFESECEEHAGIEYRVIRLQDFEWLIQQAERAQELEMKLKLSEGEKGIKTELNNAAVRIIEEKDMENARLREALESIIECSDVITAVEEIAKAALEGEE